MSWGGLASCHPDITADLSKFTESVLINAWDNSIQKSNARNQQRWKEKTATKRPYNIDKDAVGTLVLAATWENVEKTYYQERGCQKPLYDPVNLLFSIVHH